MSFSIRLIYLRTIFFVVVGNIKILGLFWKILTVILII